MKTLRKISFATLVVAGLSLQGAEFIAKDVNATEKEKTWIALPYLFSTDTTGLTAGVVGIFHGYIQPQTTVVATAFSGEKYPVLEYDIDNDKIYEDGEKRTYGLFGGIAGYRIPKTKRLFLTAYGTYSYFPNQRIYVDGTHDSERDLSKDHLSFSPVQTHGHNNWFRFNFRYVLPMGDSKEQVLSLIELDRGLPVNREGYGGGTPFITGQTILGTEIFYDHLSVDRFEKDPVWASNGLRLYLLHDNTDYPDDPSRGYSFKLQGSFDFGWGDSTQSWNSVDFSYSHYISTPTFSWSRQNVVAMNFWTAYSPSWDHDSNDARVVGTHRPPVWDGPRLGGWYRMRAYDANRFNDKAAIYGTVEYRVIPEYNPLYGLKWNPFPIDWFQLVAYAEVGRVNDQYNLNLLSDMKYDVGFSLRALAAKMPVRFEIATGEEGSSMWVMIQQPF